MQSEAGSVGVPNQAFHCLDFDEASGCFVLLGEATNPTTWIYRHAATTTTTGAAAQATSPVGDLTVTLASALAKSRCLPGPRRSTQGDFIGDSWPRNAIWPRIPAFPDWRVYFRVDADPAGKRIVGTGES